MKNLLKLLSEKLKGSEVKCKGATETFFKSVYQFNLESPLR